jgi:hypothetical protein
MASNTELLANIFQTVTQTLADNQHALNQADDQNHDHGTNMVQTFQTITRSLEDKKNSPESDALAHAAQQLSKETTSGSGKLYAQNLANAATQLKGQAIDSKGALQLLQTLIGSGQSQPQQQQTGQPAGSDILGSLLGGLTGGEQSQPQQQAPQSAGGDLLGSLLGELTGSGQTQPQQEASQAAGGDLLGSLLGGLTGAGNAQANNSSGAPANNGLDMGDLLNAGMAFMQAKQTGGSNASALIQAVVAGSGMGNSNHRTQSTQLVAGSFLQALGALTGKSR